MKSLRYSLYFFLAILVACKSSQPVVSSKEKLSDAQRADVTYLFYNANKEKLLGNLNNAAELFAEVIRKDGRNAASMYELSNIYSEQKKYADALFFAKSAWMIDSKNPWYAMSYADILQKNKKYNEASEVLGQLVKDFPDRADYYFEWASALIISEHPADAIKAYDKLQEQIGITKEVSLQKARLYQRINKNDKSVEELQKLIASNPADPQSYAALAEVYQAMGQKDKALETYNRILQIDPTNPFVHLSLADFYRGIGEKEKSVAELKLAFQNKELDIDTKISILASYEALVELHPELKEQAMEMCKLLLEAHPSESRAHSIYAVFLSSEKKYEEARTEYRQAMNLGSKEFQVLNQLMALDYEVKDYDTLLIDCTEAINLFPDQPLSYLFQGLAYSQMKKYSDAVSSYNSGLKMVVDNPKLEGQFYDQLGQAYNEMKEFDKSDQSFEKVLAINPKDANTLNNYAYFLSVRGIKLEHAEEMSKLSNDLEPNQASYEDTYGWIMYKMGRYDEALTWIKKSLDSSAVKSGTVLEHYGDVLYKKGDIQQALDYWQRAKESPDGGSDFLERKLIERKLVE